MAVTGRKLHPGSPVFVAKSRDWQTKFSESQVKGLKVALKEKFSSEIISQIEEAAQAYQRTTAELIVFTQADERKRAVELEKIAMEAIYLLNGPDLVETPDGLASPPVQRPIQNVMNFIEEKIGVKGREQILDSLFLLQKYSAEFLISLTAPTSAPTTKPLKKQFVMSIARILKNHDIFLGKGAGTTFELVLSYSFELLGKDAVNNTEDLTKTEYADFIRKNYNPGDNLPK